jgi:hypothetical protein
MSQTILRWRKNPVQFVTEVFNATPDDWQATALQALANHDKVSIRSGHGVGKSTLDSWAIIWFLTCHYPAKVPCSAPTMHQLRDVLWSELTYWHRRMPGPLKNEFAIKNSEQAMQFYLKSAPQASFAVARTGRKENPEALQGFHSPNLLFILDEASGIAEEVFEVAQGALSTEGAKVLMTANPTRLSGYFYDSHHKLRHRWKTLKVSCLDSPRVSQTYAEDVALQYGQDSSVYNVRVLGEFPKAEDDVVIPLHLIEDALVREIEPSEAFKPVWGLDVARYGDDRSALAKRRGNALMEPVKAWRGYDTMQTVGRVVEEYRLTDAFERPSEILVDVIGIGAGVVDRLQELGLPARGINVGESSTADGYARLRDQLWWRCRQWFEDRMCIMPEDDDLIAELVDVKYTIRSNSKIEIEPKDKMKERTKHSPDLADAFVLTFAGGLEIHPELTMDKYQRKMYGSRKRRSWRAA